MFLGEYTHTLDEKGRLTIPARWRELLGYHVVVTRGIEGCLLLFPFESYDSFMAEIRQGGRMNSDSRGLSRFFTAKAIHDEPDRQGRVTIQQPLREYAQLDGDVVLVGADSHIEIWNPEKYNEVNAALERDVKTMSDRFAEAVQRIHARTASS